MSNFFTILTQDLLLNYRSLSQILANLLSFIILITIFFITLPSQDNQGLFAIAIIWFALLSSLIFSSASFLKMDFADGTIEQMAIIFDNFETFIFAKILANWLIFSLPLLLVTPVITMLQGFGFEMTLKIFMMIFLASLILNFICCFCGSLSILENSAPIIAVIALPLIIPVFLISYSGISFDFSSSLKILCGLLILLAATTTFATAKIVKISLD